MQLLYKGKKGRNITVTVYTAAAIPVIVPGTTVDVDVDSYVMRRTCYAKAGKAYAKQKNSNDIARRRLPVVIF